MKNMLLTLARRFPHKSLNIFTYFLIKSQKIRTLTLTKAIQMTARITDDLTRSCLRTVALS